MDKIVCLGAMHDDPLGKERLHRAIGNVIARHRRNIEFLALEWAQTTYAALAPLRGQLRQRLNDNFPTLCQGFIGRFANTLAYEGDLPQELGYAHCVVWLLDGRTRDDIQLAGPALTERALSRKIEGALMNWLLPRIPNWNELLEEDLVRTATSVYMEESVRLTNLCDPPTGLQHSICSGRELYMYERLQNGINQSTQRNELSVVIIGTEHLLDFPDSFFNRCRSSGFDVERIWPHEQ
jgi:hypothetical protein